ncbi:DUF4431 domain-containing protein [Enterobacter soli]|uniref:DUF4431 domain-containing protein n=1 Tax=Enterobacter soli TaxID=885040 RepID=UPI002F3FFDBA
MLKRLLLAGFLSLLLTNMAFADCFSEGDKIIANGVLKQETFPGPPNYESISDGDTPESVWVVNLDSEVSCAKDAQDWGSRKKMQVINTDSALKLTKYEGQHINMNGVLVYAETGHDHTPLLINATSIENNQKTAQQDTQDEPKRQADDGKMTTESACEHYVGLIGDAYGYLSTDNEAYLRSSLAHAKSLDLPIKYVDFILNGISSNKKDSSTAEILFNGKIIINKNGNLSDTEEFYKTSYNAAISGCLANPGSIIPSWERLKIKNLIVDATQ